MKKDAVVSEQSPVILTGSRTPFMRSFNNYQDLSTFDLGRMALAGLRAKMSLDPEEIETVIYGTVAHDPSKPNIARECLLGSGLSERIPAYTVSLACISSNMAATNLAEQITSGRVTAGIIGGVDSCSDPAIRVSKGLRRILVKMSRVRGGVLNYWPVLKAFRLRHLIPDVPKIVEFSNGKSMGYGAELLAQQVGITREETDEFAKRSHLQAVEGQKKGFFAQMITPLNLPPKFKVLTADDGPRADTSSKSLAKLRAAFDKKFGVCTAGNSSFLSDGASALLLSSMKKAKEHNLSPLAILQDYVYAAGDPLTEMLTGPALSIPILLKKNNLKVSDIAVWEIHEAFASQVLANIRLMSDKNFLKERLNLDESFTEVPMEQINVYGGSLSLGHPFAATGARLLHTAALRLQASGKQYAVVSGCAAGGHGSAILLKNPVV